MQALPSPISTAPVVQESSEPLYLEPFLRTFVLGVGSGALLEAAHVALQVLTGSFPGMADFSPLLFADHAVSL